MHDPLTVAFEIRYPWFRRSQLFPKGYHEAFVTIWHRDPGNMKQPDVRRSDDTCGWPWPNLNAKEVTYAENLIDNEIDNVRGFFGAWDEKGEWELQRMKADLKQCFRLLKRLYRPWYKHPRWHFWHWRIQIHPVQQLRRWLFDRCASCGNRFAWGYSPVADSWSDNSKLRHFECCQLKAEKNNDHP